MTTIPPIDDAWFLCGPTASGKTAVGVELAEILDAEIISMDSMAVYRGMDIGTAKPSAHERRRVPHHLIDVIDPREKYSLAQYVAAAHEAVGQIRARRRQVLFVGGTPLYLKSLLRGIFEGPPADWPLRRQLAEEASRLEPTVLHARVAALDPASAARLHPNDTRRLIRVLEVYEQTGRPMSDLQRQFETGCSADECRVFVLDRTREELHRRIDARVNAMFAAGLVDEVQQLLAAGARFGRTARQAVGYREVLALVACRANLEDTIELVKQRTRQFARRQGTWFRSLAECRFVPVAPSDTPRAVAERIVAQGRTK